MQLTWGDRRSCGTGRHENPLLDVGRAQATSGGAIAGSDQLPRPISTTLGEGQSKGG
jgi:hypothetical protein